MSESQTYSFSRNGCGVLDLEVDSPTRQVYQTTLPHDIKWKTEGLDLKERHIDQKQFFFEWQKIQFTYSVKSDVSFAAPIELRINNRTVKKSQLREGIHLLSGQFSFDDAVGETRIEIRDSANKLIFSLCAEVFPQKMDYSSDYKAMMADISLIIQNLAYDSLKDTFKKSRARVSGHSTQNEWWNILDALFGQLILNLRVIKRQPKHEIRNNEKALPVEKIKQASKRNTVWLQKNVQFATLSNQGIRITKDHLSSHALSSKKFVTYDTYENRFVAWAIRNVIEQLRRYQIHVAQNQGKSDYKPLMDRMKTYQSQLQGILHENPFNETSNFEKRSHFSTSLTRGTGYRDFLHIYLLLTRGLEISNNDIFNIEQKNISTLYEYWCFLKLVQLLKEQNSSELEYQDLVKFSATRFKVELVKGQQSKVRFNKKGTDESTTIYFNREFTKEARKVFTYDQIPDFSIEFKKKGFEKPFWYLFDAKYRFEEKSDRENNTFNVPQDAIGQLHRYRDAILHTVPNNSTYRGAIKNLGGIILYPYPLKEADFKNNVYFKSISDVNIGALPFLPSKTGLISELLNNLINKLPEEHFERFIEMDRSEYDSNREKWNEWITIGTIPSNSIEKRRSFIRENGIFHIPFVRNTHSKLYMSKSILVYDIELESAVLYDVEDWEIMTDKELISKGADWILRTDKYVAFNLTNPRPIEVPNKLGTRIGYRYTTKAGLKNYLETKNKDYFYLANPDAARLYETLLEFNIDFNIGWGNNVNDPSQVEFNVGEKKILSSANNRDLNFEIDNKMVHINELLRFLGN